MTDPISDTSLRIVVNGEPRTAPSASTVAALLRQLGISPDRVAVEINLHIIDRHAFEARALEEGDRVEVISFIGGGSGGEGRWNDLRCSQNAHDRNVLVPCAQ